MKIVRLLILGGLLFAALVLAQRVLPDRYRNDFTDWLGRLTAPNFDWPPDAMARSAQAPLISEYQRRGYRLKCYGSLRTEYKIGKNDDYLCWSLIKSAYDNIPARMVTFFFAKEELTFVRLEFPESSFDRLQDYLRRRLADKPRIDQIPGQRIGTDVFGKPLMVWLAPDGLVTTSAESTPEQPITLLWSRSP
ncbi:MAG: hypothetical protein IPJ21_11910 [Sterolibacteriaceae bacterium]|nr:hypothetical protein [Sterolibacteriaceae bacterium]MBK9084559.1 hypothetical protein [Sterolibacteriaceae bacterium]